MPSYFMIREKGTEKFLPDPYRSRLLVKVSYTHTEPTDSGEHVPRLFVDPKKAKAALTQWLRGRQTAESGYQDSDGEWIGGGIVIEHDPSRIKENMEIVEIEIRVL